MNRMDYVDKVKPGDTVRIVPIAKVPNADREFKVNDLLEEGFLYGLSTTSDGYVMPYSWIKSLKVIKPGKDVSSCRRFTKYPSNYVKAWTMYGGGPSVSEYEKAVDEYYRHLEEDFSPFKVYEYCTDYHTPGDSMLITLGDQEWLFRLHRSWQWGPEGDLYGPYEAGYFTPVTYSSYFPGLHRNKFIQEFPSLEAAMTYLYTTLDVEE